MSLDSYANLKASLATYSGRADLATRGFDDDAIDNCEAEFNRRLRVRGMETTTTGTMTTDDATISLPTGFLEARTFSYTPATGTAQELEYKTPEQLAGLELVASGAPYFYTFAGGEIRFERPADQDYAWAMTYYKAITPLSGSATSNFLLAAHPDAYLAGSMKWVSIALGDPQSAGNWAAVFDRHIAEISRSDARERFKPAAVFFDVPGTAPKVGSILTDGQ